MFYGNAKLKHRVVQGTVLSEFNYYLVQTDEEVRGTNLTKEEAWILYQMLEEAHIPGLRIIHATGAAHAQATDREEVVVWPPEQVRIALYELAV